MLTVTRALLSETPDSNDLSSREKCEIKRIIKAALLIILLLSAFFSASNANAGLTSPFETNVARAVERMERTRINDGTEENIGSPILGGITPHHGIALDMIVRFYERISSDKVQRVWLFSPDHFGRAKKYASTCGDEWQTECRILEADVVAKSGFIGTSLVENNSQLFAEEHGITIHIPLIARYFPNATIVPMVLKSNIPDIALLMLKNYILEAMQENDIIILSMDLSHYKRPEEMAADDQRSLEVLTKLEPLRTDRIDVDARRAASLVLHLLREMGAERGSIMEHMDSTGILGYRIESGTSYATIIYSVKQQM
jgi:AmmeMemoRadiSam system protein B